MSGTFGSWCGTTVAGQDMIPILRQKEEERTTRKRPMVGGFSILQLGVSAPEGTELRINGEKVVMPKTCVFQIGYGLVDLESLVFDKAVAANIVYIY